MHVDSGLRLGGEEAPPPETPVRPAERGPAGSLEQDKELMAIFERTYGKVEQRAFQAPEEARPHQPGWGRSTASGHRSRGRSTFWWMDTM